MCGIAGAVAPEGVGAEALVRALAQLAHRGPDDAGCLQWEPGTPPAVGLHPTAPSTPVALVHRRLSILDLTKAGWQPFAGPGGDQHVVYNGEIYNYLELRAELEQLGHRFRSRTDTEVLLAAYRTWGAAAMERFVGMFAFAVLDLAERRLVLARDPFGIKPLYYTSSDRGFAFSSEIRPLLDLAGVSRRVHPQRLYDYLRHGVVDHDDGTLLADVRQVPPGHHLEVRLDDPGRPTLKAYWEVALGPPLDVSLDEAAAHLRELFVDSVRLHLRSDRSVGAALSGGIDSSSIVAAMREVGGDALDIHTISYVADDPRLDERHWSDMVGRAAGADVQHVRVDAGELRDDIEALVSCQELPFGSTSIYAQHRVFRRAAELGLTVMLDGQGADEMLGGYRPYVAARLVGLVREGRVGDALGLLRQAAPAGRRWSADLLPLALAPFLPARVAHLGRSLAGREAVPAWLEGAWFEARGVVAGMAHRGADARALRPLLHDHLTRVSLPALLRYEDRNSMAHSIESRVPFLTPQLVSFVFSLPEDLLVDGRGTTKAVFRRAMRGIVPDPVLDRRDKIGFATPEHDWLRALKPWVDEVLGSEAARSLPVLRHHETVHEWEAVAAGTARFDWRVWRWVNLVRWADQLSVDFA